MQGLRLLGCYLKARAVRTDPAQPDNSSEASSPALNQGRLSMRQARRDAATADAVQDWIFTCGRMLPQVTRPPPLLRPKRSFTAVPYHQLEP